MAKYITIILIFFSPLVSLAQNGFKIQGKIKGLSNQDKIYLVYNAEGKQVVDSAIVKDGLFNFSGNIRYPEFANVSLNINPYVQKPAKGQTIDPFRFYLENSLIELTAADSLKNIVITGSPGNKLYATLKAMMKANDDNFATLNKAYYALSEASKKDNLIMDSLIRREKILLEESYRVHLDFAKKISGFLLKLNLPIVRSSATRIDARGKRSL